jgi:hypothetical protein
LQGVAVWLSSAARSLAAVASSSRAGDVRIGSAAERDKIAAASREVWLVSLAGRLYTLQYATQSVEHGLECVFPRPRTYARTSRGS